MQCSAGGSRLPSWLAGRLGSAGGEEGRGGAASRGAVPGGAGPLGSAGGDEGWGGAAGRGAEPGGSGRGAALRVRGAGLPARLAGRRLGSAGGEEGRSGTTGHSWSGANGAVHLCRAGGEGGKMGDGWLRSGRGRTTQPGASRDEMRGLTDRELDPERES